MTMTTKHNPASDNLDPEQTRILAHRFWEQAGCPTGLDLQFWLAAEQELRSQRPKSTPTSRAKPSGGTAAKRHSHPPSVKAAKAR